MYSKPTKKKKKEKEKTKKKWNNHKAKQIIILFENKICIYIK